MTQDEFIASAADRVAEYLRVRATRRGLDTECIHSFDDRYELRFSDLNALVCAVRAAALSQEKPHG
jgi:hypothetical protein